MEGLAVNPSFWRGKRVFLTGHTGFKGGWLSLWLQRLGARVTGYALLAPTEPSLFGTARVAEGMTSIIGDIRDGAALVAALSNAEPEVVIHMAAQPLVRRSYADPVETYSTNIMGTVHLLEAVRQSPSVRAVVNVTTDKCYENKEWVWGYREEEPMGGDDPYSSSKGCVELISKAYRKSFLKAEGLAMATARAGNVIGGGDWAPDRLVPDVLRALEMRQPVLIRNPHAVRPWQHVLEPLSGYLLLAERLYERGQLDAEGWNFGPTDEDIRPVQWIVERLCEAWGQEAKWTLQSENNLHEVNNLRLDISKVKRRLSWAPRWSLQTALVTTIDWHRAWLAGQNMRAKCLQQIQAYGER